MLVEGVQRGSRGLAQEREVPVAVTLLTMPAATDRTTSAVRPDRKPPAGWCRSRVMQPVR